MKNTTSFLLALLLIVPISSCSKPNLAESELRLFGLGDAPAFYADGRRSILDIRVAVTAEYGPISVEALELYFRAFEKAGVLKIREK